MSRLKTFLPLFQYRTTNFVKLLRITPCRPFFPHQKVERITFVGRLPFSRFSFVIDPVFTVKEAVVLDRLLLCFFGSWGVGGFFCRGWGGGAGGWVGQQKKTQTRKPKTPKNTDTKKIKKNKKTNTTPVTFANVSVFSPLISPS